MEMTEGIYRHVDPGRVDRPSMDNHEETDTGSTSDSRENLVAPSPQPSGPWKRAAVCLGLLCALLLSAITLLSFKMMETKQLQTSDKEKLQMQSGYDNMTIEYKQLQITYNNLKTEKSQLQTSYSNLSREKLQLQSSYDSLNKEKSGLQTRNDRCTTEKSSLQTSCNNLNTEKSQLQDKFDTMAAEKDKLQKRMEITKYAVDVTLDPDTAENNLILSADGKQVRHVDSPQNLPDNPKRFDPIICVLGMQGFTSGRFYYEVEVSGKTAWTLGVARESINRKGSVSLGPSNGYWTIWLRNGDEYMAHADPSVVLSLKEKPERVGVFVDYGAGLVSFYDADRWNLMYSFQGVSFKEKIYQFFSPSPNYDGKNSSPLIIVTPISCPKSQLQDKFHTMAAERDKLQKRMEITQYAVDVTLDPDTAENNLILSADGKQVRHVETLQNFPDNPKRFDPVICVLGKQGFTSGRFYYEVEVSGKTEWDLGVARESINRKGSITLKPDNGYWTIMLTNGDEYKAIAGPSILLSLKEKPERVGVFVDYEAGLVSFYDADRWNLIYSFRGVSFKEKIFPFLYPSLNYGDKNSYPLIIITPISCPK
ncbi:nuclear factor 7, ovary-like [Clupea harengus]|uniref:Nuclear factor 7, ovary-like n=1 Tax=Clupea harengus TaxID=7950 RepID=A0A6P8GNX0_CLUHA|nr:nuclear factor 7, ovary-like [Clupea harengus]